MARPAHLCIGFLSLFLATALGCQRPSLEETAVAPDAIAPPKLDLRADREDLIFTYIDDDGRLHDVSAAAEVPLLLRKQVIVRDLSLPPDALRTGELAIIADLTQTLEDGRWPYAVVNRCQLDRALLKGELGPEEVALDAEVERRVILYGAPWCGACSQARTWLEARGIDFVEKDVEANPRAAKEMERKMRRAGLKLGGVPVLDVKGTLLIGFDEARLSRLLAP